MEPFFISCTTCKSRLKVRNQAAIGQILSCPKCGSMVLVEPPQAGASTPDAAAAKAETAAAAALVGNTFTDVAAALPPSTLEQHAEMAAAPGLAQSGAAGEDRGIESAGGASTASTATAIAGEAEPALPQASWASPSAGRLQPWLPYVAAAIAGTVLAFAVVGFVVRKNSRQPAAPLPQVVEAAKNDDLTEAATAAAAASLQQDDSAPVVGHPAIVEPPTPQLPMSATEQPASVADAASGVEKASDAAIADGGPAPASSLPPLPQPPAEGDETPAASEAAEEADDIVRDSTSTTADNPVDRELALLSKSFPDLASLLAGTATPAESADEPPADAPQIGDDALAADALPAVDVQARLADSVVGIEVPAMPLADFLQLVTNLSTIPIALDLDALAAIGLSPESTVTVQKHDATIAGILKSALEPLELGCEQVGHVLIVTHNPLAPPEASATPYDVADLTENDPQSLDRLATFICELIARGSWTQQGGKAGRLEAGDGRIAIWHSAVVKHQAALLCDKLRAARARRANAENADAAILIPRSEQADKVLAASVTMNFTQPARLARVLAAMHDAAKARILVDWPSVVEAGVTPASTVSFSAVDMPLEQALAALVKPLGLTYRIVDGQTLEVTTPSRLAMRLELEVYPVGDLLSEQLDGLRLMQRVRAHLGDELFAPGGAGAALAFDPQSEALLASLPQLEQAQLARLIEYWRASP